MGSRDPLFVIDIDGVYEDLEEACDAACGMLDEMCCMLACNSTWEQFRAGMLRVAARGDNDTYQLLREAWLEAHPGHLEAMEM